MILDKRHYTTENSKIQENFVNLSILREKRMKLAFIISEYNPFHCGHEYMIRQIRKKLGDQPGETNYIANELSVGYRLNE